MTRQAAKDMPPPQEGPTEEMQATEGSLPVEEEDVVDGEASEETEEQTPEEAVASAEIVVRERDESKLPASIIPSPQEWEATLAMAKVMAAAGTFVPRDYQGKPEAVVAAILAGREIGIGPMQALRQIHVIEGRPSLSADLTLAKMRQGGITILDSESTAEVARIHAKRRDTGEEATVEWTYAEATQIVTKGKRLIEKDNWTNYPADMLWARCVGRLARRLGSDLLGALVYTSEEVADWEPGGYGGDGYGTEVRPAVTQKVGGVELRADAPKTPAAIGEALKAIDPEHPWVEWFDEAAKKWFGLGRSELDAAQTKELWARWSNGVAALSAMCFEKGDFPPPTRVEVQEAMASAFDGTVLLGALVPMDQAEYEATVDGVFRPEGAEEAPGAGETPETPETGGGRGDAALSPEAQAEMKRGEEDGS